MSYTLQSLSTEQNSYLKDCVYVPEWDISAKLFRIIMEANVSIPRKSHFDMETCESIYNQYYSKMISNAETYLKNKLDIKLPLYYFIKYATVREIMNSDYDIRTKDILLGIKADRLSYSDIKTFTEQYPDGYLGYVVSKPRMKQEPDYTLDECLQGLFEYPVIDTELDKDKMVYSLYYHINRIHYEPPAPNHFKYLSDDHIDKLRNTVEAKFIAFQQIQYQLLRDYDYFVRVYPLFDHEIIGLMKLSVFEDFLNKCQHHIDVIKLHFPDQDIDAQLEEAKKHKIIAEIKELLTTINDMDFLQSLYEKLKAS